MTMTDVTRISADERAYHRKVLEASRQAQAILQSWMAHLSEVYGLTQGDRIGPDGEILPGPAHDTMDNKKG
jgi:hypothetical protein